MYETKFCPRHNSWTGGRNYSRVIFDLKMQIWKSKYFLEKLTNFKNYK